MESLPEAALYFHVLHLCSKPFLFPFYPQKSSFHTRTSCLLPLVKLRVAETARVDLASSRCPSLVHPSRAEMSQVSNHRPQCEDDAGQLVH